MHQTLYNAFPPFQNENSLRLGIKSVCAAFGAIRTLRILPAGRGAPGETLQCFCLLQLNPETAHAGLMSEYSVSPFGPSLSFIADVDDNWTDIDDVAS